MGARGRFARFGGVRRKPDANQKAITDALEAVGAQIFDLSGAGKGIPDIACLKPNKRDVVFLEIKTEKGTLTEAQKKTHQDWPIVTVRTIDEALRAVGVGA